MKHFINRMILIPTLILVVTIYRILKVDLCKDPTQFMRFVKGYRTEIHHTTTKDKYNLTLFRIFPQKTLSNEAKPKVALVIHGILDSSDTFAFDKTSIIHKLLDKGYEVWAANNRGNKYSCTNQNYDNTSENFWDFSFQEMGEHDVPAFYEKIFEISNPKKITLVAHSQGATQSFIALSSNKLLLSKTEKFIPLSPVLFMDKYFEETNILTTYKNYNATHILKLINLKSVLLIDVAQNQVAKFVIDLFCQKSTFVCSYLFGKTIDKNPYSLNLEKMGEYLSYCPSGTPVKSFDHFAQLIYDNNKPVFKAFDYGEEQNLVKYNQKKVPIYDISRINIPIYLIHGQTDLLSTIKDNVYVEKINSNVKRIMIKEVGHTHYTWGRDKTEFLEIMDKVLDTQSN